MTPPTRRPGRFLAIVLALIATACAGSSDDPAGPGSQATSGGQTAEIQLMLFGGPEEVAGYTAMVDEFETSNDDVEVTLTPVAEQDDLLAKLATGFAGGAPPDMFLINFRKYGQFAIRDALAPVQDFLDDSDLLVESDFVDPPLEAFRFDGDELTCMPQNVSSLVVYYNRDLFEAKGIPLPEEGWSWDDFLATATALTDDEHYGVATSPDLIRLAPFVWSNGGDVVDDPDAPTRLALDEPAARAALDFFLDLPSVHGVAPPEAAEQTEDAESRFLRGGLGMYLNSRKSTPTLRTITDFTWDVAPLPVAPGGTPVTMLHSDAYCIAAGTGNEATAWRLVEFAESPRGQEILAVSGRTVPSRLDVQQSPVFLEPERPPASAQVFVDNARIARATPHTATWTQVESVADDILGEMYYGRIDREDGLRRLIEQTAPLFGGDG